jgi:hypothetical protein
VLKAVNPKRERAPRRFRRKEGGACSFRLRPPHPPPSFTFSPLTFQDKLNWQKMGLFCDCFGRRSDVKRYSKPKYARMVEAKEPPSYSSLPIDVVPVPNRPRSWEADRGHEDARLLSSPFMDIDEKQPLEPNIDSRPSSPRFSTISLPSTRITTRTITTNNTGTSVGSRRSHESGGTLGAPPSYSSRRPASNQQSNRSSWDQRHPVLAEDWFDQFRES